MTNLEMENVAGRNSLKNYFYDEKSTMLFWICLILAIPTGGISILVFLCVKIAQFFINSSGDEAMYDRILEDDIKFLKLRAVNVMGMLPEELSLIEPIVTHGYAREADAVNKALEMDVEEKDLLKKIWSSIKSIPSKILSFFSNFFSGKDYTSHEVFFKGRDDRVRCSLVSFTMFSFTEQQIIAYFCNYDIALGIILKEYVREVFYRDVESVSYGNEIWHIYLKNGKLSKMPTSWVRLTNPSGKSIVAAIDGENDILENQIVGMKNLIRSKKEEMA